MTTFLRPRIGLNLHSLLCTMASLGLVIGGGVSGRAQTPAPQPQPMLIADFNHDGIPDVLVQSTATPTATIAFGSVPYGTFAGNAKAVTFPAACTALPAGSIAVGDFNGDGFPDIVFFCGSQAGTMLGKGDGTFGTATALNGVAASLGVVGDFNHDGKLDIAVLSNSENNASGEGIRFLAGNGDGTFVGAVLSSLTVGTYSGIAAADINGDGYPDLLLTNSPASVSPSVDVLGNNRNNTFGVANQGAYSASTTIAPSTLGSALVLVGNFFGLATTDVVVAATGANGGLYAFKNTSTGTTYSFNDPVTIPYANLTGAQAGKFTGSGFSDVAVSNGTSIAVLANDGQSNFAATYPTLTVTSTNPLFGAGDANNDGYADIYTATLPSGGPLQVVVNLTTGSATATSQPFALASGTHAISAAWAGNVNFAGSTPTGSRVVLGVPSKTTVTSNLNPSQVGNAVTFSVQVAPMTGTGTVPTGNVVLSDGVTMLTTGALDGNGNLSYMTSSLAQGTHTITAAYAGDGLYAASNGTVSQVVTQAVAATSATTLTVSSGGSPVTTVASGAVVTLTATVLVGAAAVNPGQVAFCDATATTCQDTHLLGTAQLTAAGVATYRFVPGIGTHSYKAVFLGTKANATSASGASALAVTGKYVTTAVLTSAGVQGSYALTATLSGLGSGSPSGNVVFADSSTNVMLGTVPVTNVVRSFVAGSPITAGASPNQVVPADVNGDGKPDLILGNQSGTMLTVLIGNGDGTYTALPSFGTNYEGISGLAIGDFNGDGKLDIATANGSTVGIFLGNGDGTFGAEQDFANTASSQGVYAADLNGDGKLDLVVTDSNYGISILIGNGDGTFTQPGAVLATGSGPTFQVAVADFNKDGNLDLAFGNYFDNTVSVLLGNGDGTFQAQTTYAVGAGPRATFLGDFNGDGNPDLLITNGSGNSVSVLLGVGDGTFQAQQTFAVGSNPSRASVGDLDGDGKLDIAVANENDGTVGILYGNGDGSFQTQQVIVSGSSTDDVAIRDVNGDGIPDLESVNLGDNSVTVFLNRATAAVSLPGVTLPGMGMDNVVATYGGDTLFAGSTSNILTLPSNPVITTSVITWAAPASIVYGTPLSGTQLDATVLDSTGAVVPGTFAYTPAAGTILDPGTQTLSVTFTPTATNYTTATKTVTLTVAKATPVITWATPASILPGTALGAMQLDATAAGINGAALPGVFTYTPAAGTVLASGAQTLSVSFAPTNTTDYTVATKSVTLLVGASTVSSTVPSTATLGSPATKITVTGVGFIGGSVVQVNGTAIATTLVNSTTLTAVIPAADFTAVGTLQITVADPGVSTVSPAIGFTVTAPPPAAVLSAPPMTDPGTQPTINFTITQPYPVDITATLTLGFAAATTPAIDDPSIQFAEGGRTLTFVVPADTVTVPTITLQAGTVAGTITVPITLTAGGVNVTPANLLPAVIVVPPAAPTISSVTLMRSGKQLTVVMHGFSNTREVTNAQFHFTAAAGATLGTTDLTVSGDTIFNERWFQTTDSDQYGSTFTYTQIFNTSDDATTVGSVNVTLSNSVGASDMQTAQ